MTDPHFICVADGRVDDLLWVEIDGDSESVSPTRLKELIPEIASAAELEGSDLARAATVEAKNQIRSALHATSAVIADSDSVCRVYTLDSGIQARVVERAKSFLPAG